MSSCGISIHDVGVLRTAFSRVMRRLLSRNLKSALCFLLVGSWRQCFNPSEYYKKHSATVKEHRFMVTTLRRSPVSWTITKAFPWTEDEIKSNQSWQQCLFSLALMVWFILNLLQINYGLTKRITNGFQKTLRYNILQKPLQEVWRSWPFYATTVYTSYNIYRESSAVPPVSP